MLDTFNLIEFIDKNLKNKNNKLEGQRLNEKWFIKHDFAVELQYFIKNDILNSKKLYLHINKDKTNLCECGSEKKFIGFSAGFKEYCLKCSKTVHNHMKKQGNNLVKLEKVIDFVKDKNGKYSTTKIKKLSVETINAIIQRTNYLSEDSKISERLYHIENNLYMLPICEVCGKEHNNFKFSNNGYGKTCKGKCAHNYDTSNKVLSMNKRFYNYYEEKFKSNNEYKIKLFSFDKYCERKDCNIQFTHKCGYSYTLNLNYQGHYKCPKCYPIRSKKQYEILDWLKSENESITMKFNDRQFIKPLELDILTDTFAIEYDSLMFHSYGKSNLEMFSNTVENKKIHLNKTELVEEKNIQLFRIFSNEWINKQEIWKSIINSKLGKTERIYARKCVIKEASSKESAEFLEKNHLQGKINSSVKLGLYYENELVSLMTFGKTRRSKWNAENNYELYRFCSKLNTTVVGGASKLLKYFERNYKPSLLISYANRRWSTGNLYEKIGFKFIENTTPNYFYFKGSDDSTLKSREQFQNTSLKIN